MAAGASEAAGGILLALGLLTPVAAVLVAPTMLVAVRTDHRGKGSWIYDSGFEYALTNAIVVLGLAFNGAGAWSLDRVVGRDVAGWPWGVGAAAVAVAGAAGMLGLFRDRPLGRADTVAV